tara:strand:- start:1088 stop:2146 length:1059 start_codon:yes stop_codon:yes gene_type:complete
MKSSIDIKKNKVSLVITSINKQNMAIKNFYKLCYKNNVNFYLVGDKKTPEYKNKKNFKFLSLNFQKKLSFQSVNKTPINSYSRKNIGYLYAMINGSKIIYESDDDNYPKQNFFTQNLINLKIQQIEENGFINIYKYFNKKNDLIWPRGLPLSELDKTNKSSKKSSTNLRKFIIIQRLCDENPDVDAIYRLINNKINIKFLTNKGYYTKKNSYIPFNSQNTIWTSYAFPLMYLPSNCTMRSTDIWRSYIAYYILNKMNKKVLFTSPTVYQKRNFHNLYSDFNLEIPVYRDVQKIIKSLSKVNIYKSRKFILRNLFNCYKQLVKINIFKKKEMDILKSWCNDISLIDKKLIKIK